MRMKPSYLIAATLLIILPALSGPVLVLAAPPSQDQNLLVNPSFEWGFHFQGGIGELKVADGWSAWYLDEGQYPPYWKNRRPEFGLTSEPARVHDGWSAQQYGIIYSTHTAGIYQQVSGIPKGARLHFTMWAHLYAYDDDSKKARPPLHMKIGIDPTGGTDALADHIVWSEEFDAFQWHQFSVEAVAESSTVTVFTYSSPEWPMKHLTPNWDGASLVLVATPTPTPRPPTPTPAATNTPTFTPTPVNTPTPTATPTPTVTPTPVTSSICVLSFEDSNGNGKRDAGEGLLSGAVFTISNDGRALDSYSSEGINEPHCFHGLEPGFYLVSGANPAGYESTTNNSWDVALSDGSTANIEFGNRLIPSPTIAPKAIPSPSPTPETDLLTIRHAAYGVGIIVVIVAGAILVGFSLVRRSVP
jgi:hypothetical protein